MRIFNQHLFVKWSKTFRLLVEKAVEKRFFYSYCRFFKAEKEGDFTIRAKGNFPDFIWLFNLNAFGFVRFHFFRLHPSDNIVGFLADLLSEKRLTSPHI